MKINEFKEFVKTHPSLLKSVNSGKITWQRLYEMYDLYGSDSNVFNEYLNTENNISNKNINDYKNVIDTLKNIDMDSVKSNLTSLQKALTFLEDFTKPDDLTKVSKVVNPRPFGNFFND